MLEGFGRPYPDECWYSAMARVAERSRYSKQVLKEKMGHMSHAVRLDFPQGLERFVAQLSPGAQLSADGIIYRHTSYPVYAPFLELTVKERLLGYLRGHSPTKLISLQRRYLFGPKGQRFRYCSACVEEDRRQYGETYWHREHQLSGVVVCAAHAVFLESHNEGSWPHRWQDEWIIAERVVKPRQIRKVNGKNREHKRCLEVACDVASIWSYNGPTLDLDGISKLHYWLAAEKGLMKYVETSMNGHCQNVVRQPMTTYGEALAKCGYREDGNIRLPLNVRNGIVSKHPVYHVLLARFFGRDIRSILSAKEVPKVFGNGPWPCWNERAAHYGKAVVTVCHVAQDHVHNPPIGTFSCSCGCVYSRAGPDHLTGHAFQRSYVIRKEGREDSSRCDNAAVPRLKTDLNTSFDESKTGYAARSAIDLRSDLGCPWQYETEVTVLMNRRQWLHGLENRSSRNRKTIWQGMAKVFNTLFLYDPKWLSEHLPSYPGPATIWSMWRQLGAREEVLAGAIFAAAKRLRMDPHFAVAIDQTGIAGAIHVEESRLSALVRYPKASLELRCSIETPVQYALRRIWHSLRTFKNVGWVPSEHAVLSDSGAPLSITKDPRVAEVLRFALHQKCPASEMLYLETRRAPRLKTCRRCDHRGVADSQFMGDFPLEPYLAERRPCNRLQHYDLQLAH